MPRFARRLTLTDGAALGDLWQAATGARRGRIGLASLREAAPVLERTGAFGVGIFEGEQLAAVAVALPALGDDARSEQHVPGLAHISSVATNPSRWGQGLGGSAVRAVLSLAVRRGYSRAQLWTHATNPSGLRLYEREGFVRSGRERLDDYGEPIVHFLRDLPVWPTVSRPAARMLCLDAHQRLLLLHFRDPGDGHQLWEPPGGGIEPGESPLEAVVREWAEETGLATPEMAPHSTYVARDLIWRGQRWVGDEQFFFGRTAAVGTPIPAEHVDQEMDAYLGSAWVPWRDLAALGDPVEPDLLPVLRRLDPSGPEAPTAP